MSLSGKELIRRFLQHVLPKGFMRIRHFGFLANRCRAAKPEQIRQALQAPAPNEPDGDDKKPCGEKATLCTDVRPCPCCHQPQWRAIALIAPKRFKAGDPAMR
ncbi:MAG TPA: hypothetical protein ENJ13_04600 [Chromatiales bacterium]|nr:hypothetical protein [Chromatiales bacterium]